MPPETSLIEIVHQLIEADEVQLPVFSETALRVQRELSKPEPNMQVIESIITSDQTLATQVLKIANSPFYQGLTEVASVKAAMLRLGSQELENIVLLASSKQHYLSNDPAIHELMKQLWKHAVGCAFGSAWLAKRHDYGVDKGQAFLAGLLHDAGKLLILVVVEHLKRERPLMKISESLLGEAMDSLHGVQGAKLLERWHLPEPFWVVLRDHHNPEIDEKNRLLLMVRMANEACHKLGIGPKHDPERVLSGLPEAVMLNLTEIDLAELEIALEDTALLQ